MKNVYSKNISTQFKALGIYQIAGGIIGLILTIWLIANQDSMPGLLFFLFLFVLGLYSYSIYCGTLMLQQKKNGLTHSLINQYLQIIHFSILGYAFQYISGVFLSTGIDLTNSFSFKFNIGISAWQININRDNEVIFININYVALFLIIILDKLRTKLKQKRLESEILQTSN